MSEGNTLDLGFICSPFSLILTRGAKNHGGHCSFLFICFIYSGNLCATLTQVLAVGSLISLHIQEGVPVID